MEGFSQDTCLMTILVLSLTSAKKWNLFSCVSDLCHVTTKTSRLFCVLPWPEYWWVSIKSHKSSTSSAFLHHIPHYSTASTLTRHVLVSRYRFSGRNPKIKMHICAVHSFLLTGKGGNMAREKSLAVFTQWHEWIPNFCDTLLEMMLLRARAIYWTFPSLDARNRSPVPALSYQSVQRA